NIYICHFVQPINTTKRMIIVIPKHAEYEIGFNHVAKKIHNLSVEAGTKVEVHCSSKTYIILERELENIKSSIKIKHYPALQLTGLSTINKQMTKNDLLLILSARKRSISYEPYLDNVPAKLNKYFSNHNFILIYPEQNAVYWQDGAIHPGDVNMVPIQEQLENFTRLSKAVKKMLHVKDKKKKDKE